MVVLLQAFSLFALTHQVFTLHFTSYCSWYSFLLRPFLYLGLAPQVFNHSPSYPVSCFFSLYSCSLCVSLYNFCPPQFWSSCLSVSTHFHPPCDHYYIFYCLSLYIVISVLIITFCHLWLRDTRLMTVLITTMLSGPISMLSRRLSRHLIGLYTKYIELL